MSYLFAVRAVRAILLVLTGLVLMILSAGRQSQATNIAGLQINNDFVFISLILTDKLLLASFNCNKQEIYHGDAAWTINLRYIEYRVVIYFLTELL